MVAPLFIVLAAAGAGLIEVSVDACPGVSAVEVQRIAAIELTGAPTLPKPLSARVTCTANLAELQVDDPVTRKTLVRRVDLSGSILKARPRTLALALAELVSASWSELLLQAPKVVEPVGPAPAKEVEVKAREVLPAPAASGQWRLEASAVARVLPEAATVQWGAALRGVWFPRGRWGVAFDVGAERADVARVAGRVALDSASLSLSAARWFQPLEALHVSVSGGARLGVARVVGQPGDDGATLGGTVAGVWAGPRLGGDIGWKLGPVVLGAGVEVGYAIGRVTGEVAGERPVGIDGLWVETRLTVGYRR
ncbi:MAG: hypothetical protein JNG84_02175 [Archangium sp.]|nr:hypothetical protein [Archangium sp.]